MEIKENSESGQATIAKRSGARNTDRVRRAPGAPLTLQNKRSAKIRGQKGAYMVELLMALATSSVLSATLVSSMAESQRLSDYGQNLIVATTIAQGQIDSIRNTPYNSLAATMGDHELKVRTSSSTGSVIPVVAPRPLLLESAKFEGRVFETIAPGPYAETLRVTINVSWIEGPATKNYSLTTLVAKNGINNTGTQAPGGA